jgi:hypothetical protein
MQEILGPAVVQCLCRRSRLCSNPKKEPAAGASQGQMHRLRFGTSADHERADSYLHSYCLADRDLRLESKVRRTC